MEIEGLVKLVGKLNEIIESKVIGGLIPKVQLYTDGKEFEIQFFGEIVINSAEEGHIKNMSLNDIEFMLKENINMFIDDIQKFRRI
jgi:hypothetical protein